jgi:hypothetical protein
MSATTIAISKETKTKLDEFGLKGDTYDLIINKLYESANERLLNDILFNKEDSLTLTEAKKFLKKNDS